MAKLNQIIAVEGTKKKVTEDTITRAYHAAQKGELFGGLIRTYQPRNDEGDTHPDQSQAVITTVGTVTAEFATALADLADVTATKVMANTRAHADVVVDGVVLVEKAPVEFLLFLEKRLNDVLKFIEKLPLLDPAVAWSVDAATGLYRSAPVVTNSTRKVLKNHVKAPATDKHPAQVDVYTEDEVVGTWSTVKESGAVPAILAAAWKAKVLKLVAAVKFAREEANGIEVVDQVVGAKIMGYLFAV